MEQSEFEKTDAGQMEILRRFFYGESNQNELLADTIIRKIKEKHSVVNLGIVESKKEAVNHPQHYNTGKIEVIVAIEDWNLGFHLGNVVKYVARAQHKDKELEDLEKAMWYLKRYIDKLKGK